MINNLSTSRICRFRGISFIVERCLETKFGSNHRRNACVDSWGPFANIAHGCNSVIATETALHLGEYTVTEAGFGADLGAEKFLDIKTPNLSKAPDAVVVVATIRALKCTAG